MLFLVAVVFVCFLLVFFFAFFLFVCFFFVFFLQSDNNRIERCNSRFFYNLLTAPRTISNTYALVAPAQSLANHVQHIEHLSLAVCCITCQVVRRDSSAIKFDRVKIAFI